MLLKAAGCKPRAAFLSPRLQFFIILTNPKPASDIFIFFSCGKLAYKWVCLRNFVTELAYMYVPLTNKPFAKNLTNEQARNLRC